MLDGEKKRYPGQMLRELPIPLVRANQYMFIVGCLAAMFLQQPYIILALFLIASASLFLGPRANLAFQVARPLLGFRLFYAETEAAVTQRFNQIIAVTCLGLSSLFLYLGVPLLGWLFAVFIIIAATSAVFGYCIGCTLYYRIKMATIGSTNPVVLRFLDFIAGIGAFCPPLQEPYMPMMIMGQAHNAIRRALAEIIKDAGKVDALTMPRFAEEVRAAVRCIEHHAAQEDLAMYPPIVKKRPGKAEIFYDEHADGEALAKKMDEALQRAVSDPAEILAAKALVVEWCEYNLDHLHHEEEEVMPLIPWIFKHEEAKAVTRSILAINPAEYEAHHLDYIVSNLSAGEKYVYASILREVCDPAEFARYEAIMKPLISSRAWNEFLAVPMAS